MKYYLVVCWGDVEPEVLTQVYENESTVNIAALKKRAELGPENDGIYWLSIDDEGVPEMGSWTGGFMEPADEKYWQKQIDNGRFIELE